MEDYLCCSLLILAAYTYNLYCILLTHLLNDALQSLSVFLTGIIVDQHLQMKNKEMNNYVQHRSSPKTPKQYYIASLFCFIFTVAYMCKLVYAQGFMYVFIQVDMHIYFFTT